MKVFWPRCFHTGLSCCLLAGVAAGAWVVGCDDRSPWHWLVRETRRGEELDGVHDDCVRETAARQRLAEDLVDRRISLRDAVARFRAEYAAVRTPRPGRLPVEELTDDHVCGLLLMHAEHLLMGRPDECASTLACLEAERRALRK
jgi:hypothetical protein